MTHTFVVGREHIVLFRHMRVHFADVPQVTVMLDRRHSDRRLRQGPVLAERRRGERRAVPPSIWTRLGFVVVPPSGQSASTLTK